MASKKVPAEIMPSGLLDSMTFVQLRTLIESRGIAPEALARALGRRESIVRKWLDGTVVPDLYTVEAIFRLLKIIPVLVSVDEYRPGSSLRDYLPPEEQAMWDGMTTDPTEILMDQLRDLRLQRYRLEMDWSEGIETDSDTYYKKILLLAEAARRIVDSMAKLLAVEQYGTPDAVEWLYGSEKGGCYDKEAVQRVKQQSEVRAKKKTESG